MTFQPPSPAPHPQSSLARRRPWGVTILAVMHALASLSAIPLVIFILQQSAASLRDGPSWLIALLIVCVLGLSVFLCGGIAYGLWLLRRRTYYLTLLLYGASSIGYCVEIIQQHKPITTALLVSVCIVIYLLLPQTKAAFPPERT